MTENNHRYKVLVVDDEPMNVELISVLLEDEYDIIKTYSGKEALEKIKTEKPDIVLLDIMMPGITGFEVCKKIKQHNTTQFTPVVMITALSELEDKIKAIEAGADDFLTKPINSSELVTRVKSLLKTKYLYDELIKSKERIEAQNDFKTIMANILPLLLQLIPPDKKNEVMRGMSKQVELVVWQKYIKELPTTTGKAAEATCGLMNRLGGCFSTDKVNEAGYTVINKKCPWGEYGGINPVLCMLTRAIVSRISIRIFKDVTVNITKTIAGGDGNCTVEVIINK
ncbi:MAG: response regulator [Candidatus Methanoperedens sp.]|jgi:DNA-binding response OmpR family regulator|nr:response regulator [Candidatus Methanoperedens sp.]PKL53153.1 MAG: response regulator [Candidatus Methanoperedenaceae archaeon HGW-Methanoperedenaceae-1]